MNQGEPDTPGKSFDILLKTSITWKERAIYQIQHTRDLKTKSNI